MWLPGTDDTQLGCLLVWAEQGRDALRADTSGGLRRLHPFSASPAELQRRLPSLRHATPAGRRIVVPTAAGAPLASHELLRALFTQSEPATTFGFWRVEGLTVDLRQQGAWERLQSAMAAFRPGGTPLRLEVVTSGSRGVVELNGSNSVRTEADLLSQLRVLPGVTQVALSLHRPWSA